MKSRIRIILVAAALFVLPWITYAQSGSWYYKETFDLASQNEWTNELYYSHAGTIISVIEASTQLMNTKLPGKLTFRGTVNYAGAGSDRNGLWTGKWIWNTNHYAATPERPFGWQIIRESSTLDPNVSGTPGYPGDSRRQVFNAISLFQDKAPFVKKSYIQNNRTNEYAFFDNYVQYMDHAGCWDSVGVDVRQYISYYINSEVPMNDKCKVAPSPRGNYYNTSNISLFNYQLTNNPGTTNKNPIGFRMEHNGTVLSFLINPNPYGTTAGQPNEWLTIGSTTVTWNDGLQMMIGHAQMINDTGPGGTGHRLNADWDNLLVKSAADVSAQKISPSLLPVSTSTTDYQSMTLKLSNVILKQAGTTNSGINFIKIVKPAEFRWPTTRKLTNNHGTNYVVRVRTHYDNGTQRVLVNKGFQTNFSTLFATPNSVMLWTNSSELYLVLSSQITNMSFSSNEHIYIDMRYKITNFSSVLFESYVKAELFEGMANTKKSNYSTCGWQKASGSVSSAITLQEGPSYAYASISPASVFQGQSIYNFTYYLSTENVVGRQDLRWAAIQIPDIFTNAKLTNVSSVVLGTNVKYRYLITNTIPGLTSKKVLKLNYTSSPIVSPSGLDVITFNLIGNITSGTGVWKSWTDGGSSLSISSLTNGESPNYPTKRVIVVPKGPAQAYASISPDSVYQEAADYTFTYYISTSGISNGKQDIAIAAIQIPSVFTQAKLTNFTSVGLGTNVKHRVKVTNNISGLGAGKFIRINYGSSKIASPNGLDVLTFRILGNVTVGTGAWKCWVDGTSLSAFSTITFTNSSFPSKAVRVVPNQPAYAYASISPNTAFVGASAYNFTYYVSTAGLIGRQNINWEAIRIPSNFTNGTTLGNFASVILGTNAKHKMKVTNNISGLPAGRYLKIDYSSSPIPSPDGLDVLSFSVLGGNVTTGTGYFRSFSDNNPISATSSTNGENIDFFNKNCVVLPKGPAQGYASISPNSIFQATKNYTFTYYLSTTGISNGKQEISDFAFQIPTIFTQARLTNFSSVALGTNVKYRLKVTNNISGLGTGKFVRIRYGTSKIASPNGLDVISFSLIGNVTAGTGSWKSWVDGTGLTGTSALSMTNASFPSKAVVAVPNQPAEAFAAISPRLVNEASSSFPFTYYISTSGVPAGYEDIGWVAIRIPEAYTNTKLTNFDSVLMGTNEKSLVKITNNISGLPVGKYIRMNYQNNRIASPGGLDVFAFTAMGSVVKGTAPWPAYVASSALGASSKIVGTNSSYPSYMVRIGGESPLVDGEITYPASGNPRVLFNTVTMYTLEYKLRNTSLIVGNKIQRAVIRVPGMFTNIAPGYSTLGLTPANMKVGKLGTVTTLTLNYAAAGLHIPRQDQDLIRFASWHKIQPGNSSNAQFSAVVDNSNGQGWVDVNTSGFVNDIRITDPQPIGAASIVAMDGVVYTSDTTNRFRYRVRNNAPTGTIDFIRIVLPNQYFSGVTMMTSTLVSSAAFTVSGSNLIVNYNSQGKSIGVGLFDDIQFRATDTYTGTTPVTSTVYAILSNLGGKVSDASDLNPPDETRAVTFVPQDARVQTYVSNFYVKTEVTTSTLYFVVRNSGDAGNLLQDISVAFSGSGGGGDISTIDSVTSPVGGTWNVAGTVFSKNGYNLNGGLTDIVKVVLSDTITTETFRDLIATVTVNTSVNTSTTIPSGKGIRLFFQTPPPSALASVSPNVLFTSAAKVTNHVTVTVYNNGEGSNDLRGVVIDVPSLLTGKVTGVSAGGTLSGSASQIAVSYSSTPLAVGNSDQIVLVVTNNLAVRTNLPWVVKVSNNDMKGLYTNVGVLNNGKKTLSVVQRPNLFISSPLSIEDASVTNTVVFKVNNTSAQGRPVMGAKIDVPDTVYTVVSGSVSSPWLNSVKSVSNGFIWVDYAANPLSAGAEDTVSFRVTDNISKGTNSSVWIGSVKYFTNDGYYVAGTNGGLKTLRITMAPPAVQARLSRDYVYVTRRTNDFTIRLTNMGALANEITKVKIQYPSALNVALGDASSSKIADDVTYISYGPGTVTLAYKDDGNVIPGGSTDNITVRFGGTMTNISKVTLTVLVNNTDPVTETYSPATGTLTIDSVYPANSYVSPNIVDVTTYSNNYVFRINNVGGKRPVQKAVVHFPDMFAALTSAQSTFLQNDAANIRFAGTTSMTLGYSSDASGPIPTTGADEIVVRGVDSRNYGVTNLSFRIWIDDGSGYADTIVAFGQSKDISYTMPNLSAVGKLDGSTPTLSIYTNNDTKVRNFNYAVTNTGLNANAIWYVQLTLPPVFANATVGSIVNTWPGATVSNIKVTSTNWQVRIHYNPAQLLPAGEKDMILISLNDVSNQSQNSYGFMCEARNLPAGTLSSIDSGAKIRFLDNAPYKAAAYLDSSSTNIYTLDKSASLSYWVYNNSIVTNITSVAIAFDHSKLSLRAVESSVPGATYASNANGFTVTYPVGSPLVKAGSGVNYDKLTIRFDYDLSVSTNFLLSCNADFGGAFYGPAFATVGQSQNLKLKFSTYGQIVGQVFPSKIPMNLELRNVTTGGMLATNIFGGAIAAIVSDTNGAFKADLIPPGKYDVRFSDRDGLFDADYYLQSIEVIANRITNVGEVGLRNAKVILDRANTLPSWVDTNKSQILLPKGSLPANVYVDISKATMTAEQVAALAKNKAINDGSQNAPVFNLDIRDSEKNEVPDISLNSSAEVRLAYDQALVTAMGWDESTLAIFGWDDDLERWIPLGGKIDAGSDNVTVTVNRLASAYAVMPSKVTESGPIRAVTAAPNPFTPAGEGIFQQMRLSFVLSEPTSGVRVNIYNMKGELVRAFKQFNENIVNAEIWWDGKDDDGYAVPAGVYIYQIRAGKNKFTGTVLIAK